MARRNNPYFPRVVCPLPFVVVVVNSVHCMKIQLPLPGFETSCRLCVSPKAVFHLVAYCPFDSIDLPCEITLSLWGGNGQRQIISLGSLEGKNELANFETQFPVVSARVDVTNLMTKHSKNEESLFDAVLDLFHDTCLNPALGALKLQTLFCHLVSCKGVLADILSFLDILRGFSEVCHCYLGKTGDWQVVLKSPAKRVQLDGKKSHYLSLLEFVSDVLGTTEGTSSDLFLDLQRVGLHNAILASNFTILKKFLNKYNSCFRWFQDQSTKTTKVIAKCCVC